MNPNLDLAKLDAKVQQLFAKELAEMSRRVDLSAVTRDRGMFGIQGRTIKLETSGVLSMAAIKAGRPSEALKITGQVLPYGIPSDDFGGYREMYQAGCFGDVSKPDVRVLFSHNPSMVLGRTSAGTAALLDLKDGLHLEVEVPDTYYGTSLLVSVARGDIDGLDVMCRITKSHQETYQGSKLLVIEQAKLIEVSVSTWSLFSSNKISTTTGSAAHLAAKDKLQ